MAYVSELFDLGLSLSLVVGSLLVKAQGDGSTSSKGVAQSTAGLGGILMEIAMVFILGSAYYAMALTNWATIQGSASIANPRSGTSSMWLQAAAQWIALLLYLWALVAPKLLPDRDFGN